MENHAIYSICITTYNSAEIVKDAMEPLIKLDPEKYEIVICDNCSNDGTLELLKEYSSRISLISIRCSRGLGRQIAMEKSNGEIIIHLTDFDVAYIGLQDVIENYENRLEDKIFLISPSHPGCNGGLYIGKRELFYEAGGFPDLNYAEDGYFNRWCEFKNLIIYDFFEYEHKCLTIKNKSSGSESRYEKNLYKSILRRLFATRDILFVTNYTFSDLMRGYSIKGYKKYIYGIPLFVIGKTLATRIHILKPPPKKERI